MKKLYLELSSLEHISVTEENSYMRDYIFNEGVLTELHFDKIKKTNL